jgi:hypothetical protein
MSNESELYVEAYNLIMELRIEEFEARNNRKPDEFEIDTMEHDLLEDDIRAAMDYLRDNYDELSG